MTTEPVPAPTPIIPPTAGDLLPTPTAKQPWYDAFISRNAKALAALVIGGLAWGTTVVHSSPAAITADEWLLLGGTIATALGVYGATNAPPR